MNSIENGLGYLVLTSATVAEGILMVKASHIVVLANHEDMGVVVVTSKDSFWVKESMVDIIEQLENIHPSMR